MTRRMCIFAGHVQGVGFRYTVQHLAGRYAVGGYVRNLPDGRVEMVAEGEADELARFIEEIQERMSGFIRQAHINDAPATGEFRGFTIRH